MEIDQARLMVLATAHAIDNHGTKAARKQVSMRFVMPGRKRGGRERERVRERERERKKDKKRERERERERERGRKRERKGRGEALK